jgi:restriction system protein
LKEGDFMGIPDYETLMLPILKKLSDDKEYKTRELKDFIIQEFHISPEETKILIPSGRAKLVDNRVGWACTYLRKAGLIHSPQRAINKITSDGLQLLKNNPKEINNKTLMQINSFKDFQNRKKEIEEEKAQEIETAKKTPEEIIGTQNQIIIDTLKNDLLEILSQVEPSQFEQIVVDLLIAMGYGGSVEDAGSAIGQTNDGGIDGVIKEDELGLDSIFIQAKRWQNSVPIKEVRDFAGALLSKRSNKGVFITTSSFSPQAYEFVESIDRKIILIDGDRLARLMLRYNLGFAVKEVIELKEIDTDYFNN